MKRMQMKMLLWALCLLGGIVGLSACGDQANNGAGGGGELSVADTAPLPDTASVADRIRRTDEKLRYSPKNWELWYERSLLWYEAGNPARAMADIDKSILYHITNPEAYHTKGFYHYAQDEDEEAMKNFKKSIDMGSENPETYYLTGQIHFFKEEYAMAKEAYNAAIRRDSMQPIYYFGRGYLAEAQKKYNDAISDYEMALKRNPTFVKALLALHDLYLGVKNNPDEAYAYNERIIMVDSTQPVARFNQGNFFMAKANAITDEARQPEFVVLLKVAVAEYGTCLRHDPNFIQAYYNRGYCFYLMEKYNLASQDFSTVIELDPYNKKAFFMLASIQEGQGDLTSALENYRQAVKIDPSFRDAVIAVKELEAR